MITRPSPWLTFLAVFLLFTSVVSTGPLQKQKEPVCQTVTYVKSELLKSQLALNKEQDHQIRAVLERRATHERHLRRQMRTTLTPHQQQKLRTLWTHRSGNTISEKEKDKIRLELGVTESQEDQFQAYRNKIAIYRRETLEFVAMRLRPEQESTFRQMALEF